MMISCWPLPPVISSKLGQKLLHLVDQLGLEARQRQGHLAVLQRVGHAADAVVPLHQQVLALDLLARGVLLWRVEVLDQLEDIGEGRQVEDQHHHALDARRDAEAVAAVAQVHQQVAVEAVLALLVQADGAVDLGPRLAGHQRAQEQHVGAGHRHVDQEVRTGVAEQHLHVVLGVEDGVDHQLAVGGVQQRQGDGRLLARH